VGKAAVDVLAERGAALLANHGMVAVGKSPSDALHITALVERSAEIILGAVALGGATELPADMNRSFGDVYKFLRTS
jgi:L-fuculose-phosphate aldolase